MTTETNSPDQQDLDDFIRAADGLGVWLDWMKRNVGESCHDIRVGGPTMCGSGVLLTSALLDWRTEKPTGAHVVVDVVGNFLLIPAELRPYVRPIADRI